MQCFLLTLLKYCSLERDSKLVWQNILNQQSFVNYGFCNLSKLSILYGFWIIWFALFLQPYQHLWFDIEILPRAVSKSSLNVVVKLKLWLYAGIFDKIIPQLRSVELVIFGISNLFFKILRLHQIRGGWGGGWVGGLGGEKVEGWWCCTTAPVFWNVISGIWFWK